jgi:hypothetical protein
MTGVIIGLKWNAMLEQLAEALSPVISLLQEFAEKLLDMVNEFLEIWNYFHKDKKDLITPGQQRTAGMKSGGGHEGPWEKIGFSFPNPKSDNTIQQTIASNTGVIAQVVTEMRNVIIEGFKAQVTNPWNFVKSLNPLVSAP